MATQKAPSTRTTAVARQRAEAKAQAGQEVATDAASEALEAREFQYDGVTYKIPPVGEWSIDVMESVEDQHWLAAVRALLGAEQWATFKSKPRDNRQFFELVGKVFGGDESRAE